LIIVSGFDMMDGPLGVVEHPETTTSQPFPWEGKSAMPQQATPAFESRQTECAALPDPYSGDPWSWAFVIFRHIPGFPGYGADTDGNIWSCRIQGRCNTVIGPWRRLKESRDSNGYRSVTLRISGRSVRRSIHSLVLKTFVGPCPEGMEARHFPDPNPTNNRARNLSWGTPNANGHDRIIHGTSGKGSRNARAKLIEADVVRLRAMWSSGITTSEIAKTFGISPGVAWKAATRKTWKHVG
jgi:HNH endonuclease